MFYFQGDITQSVPESNTPLPDINISTYLTTGPVPRPSISRVESDDSRSPDDEPSESRVFIQLEPPMSASFDSLPRHLFVNTDVSTFCQSDTDQGKAYVGDVSPLVDVFLPEVIQTEGEETVTCDEDKRQIEPAIPHNDSSKEKSSPETKYANLCV